jgi:hypothetical protein
MKRTITLTALGAFALLGTALLSQAEEVKQAPALKGDTAACNVAPGQTAMNKAPGLSPDRNPIVCESGHPPHFANEIAPGDPGSTGGSGGSGGSPGKALLRFLNGIFTGDAPAGWLAKFLIQFA